MSSGQPTTGERELAGGMWPNLLAVVLASLLSPFFLAETSRPAEADMTTVLTAADEGRLVELGVGDNVVIRLPENATTGYRWIVDAVDEGVVEVKEGPYASTSNALGSGGEAQWIVHAKAAGLTQLRLKCWRRWEGESSVIERYVVTLRIVR